MTMKLLWLCLLLGLYHSTWAKKYKCHGGNISSCTECIKRGGPGCAWCMDPAWYPCHTPERLLKYGCAETHIYNPQGSVEVVRNNSRADQTEAQPAFLQPQEVNITLRPGAPQSFPLTVFLPEDHLTSELTMDFSPIPAGIHITYATISTQNPLLVQVDVELTQCPGPEKNQNSTVHMTPRDSSLTLDLHLTLECSCDCEGERVENSSACNGRGALVCGGCECNPPYHGDRCEYQRSSGSEEDRCRNYRDTGPNIPVCSGNGVCVEGHCWCNRQANPEERYTGVYCECNNFHCPTRNMKLCDGHGWCECGQCICHRNWTGEDCSCSLDTSGCLASNGYLCNARGICDCGVCKCTDSKFQGPTCEECPTCWGLCPPHRTCVECRAYGTGSRKSSCEEDCSYLNLTKVDSRDDLDPPGVRVAHCKERDENDCWYYYTLTLSADQAWVTKDKECPANPWNPFGWGI